MNFVVGSVWNLTGCKQKELAGAIVKLAKVDNEAVWVVEQND